MNSLKSFSVGKRTLKYLESTFFAEYFIIKMLNKHILLWDGLLLNNLRVHVDFFFL